MLEFGSTEISNSTATQIYTNTPSPLISGIQLKADADNSTNMYIGKSNVSATKGFQLAPGDGIFLPGANLSDLYALAGTNGDLIFWIIV